jgi:amino acid transporter
MIPKPAPRSTFQTRRPLVNRVFKQLKSFVFGSPLDSKSESLERLNIPLGLAIFASDALSSSAYATDEILIALVGIISISSAANNPIAENGLDLSNLFICIPVAIAITALLAIVVVSYRQVIKAYPDGGGAYIVAKDNLGPVSSLLAAGALLLDYVLTVAVSVCAGIAAFMAMFHATTGAQAVVEEHVSVGLAILAIIILAYINLRGIRESARVIAFPAFSFIFCMLSLIVIGVSQSMVYAPPQPPVYHGIQIGVEHLAFGLLFLKAFAHGCAALTGIEAVSNGIKAFKEPSVQTANRTMILMGSLLGVILLGLTYLAFVHQIVPVEGDTVVSQIARAVLSKQDIFYYVIQFSTMSILLLAANTSFGGFPRLAMILAQDGFLPRQLMNVGDRLVYSNGIVLLAAMAAVLVIAFHASVHNLMPMYAIGVFLSFTLAQGGMVARYLREKTEKPQFGRMIINGVGALVTCCVCALLCIEKLTAGAWIVLICLPLLIALFRRINRHYETMRKQLAVPKLEYHPKALDHTVLVLVASLNRGVLPALEYARSISTRIEAVHVELNSEATAQLQKDWQEWGSGIPLTVLKSPFRSLSGPLMKYIDEVEKRHDHDIVTIIIPEFVAKKWWHNLLHNQTAIAIKTMLMFKPGKVVTTIRYHLSE